MLMFPFFCAFTIFVAKCCRVLNKSGIMGDIDTEWVNPVLL